jgi:hypothetical protein
MFYMPTTKVTVTIPERDRNILESHKSRNVPYPFIRVLDFEPQTTRVFVNRGLVLVQKLQDYCSAGDTEVHGMLEDLHDELTNALEGREL